MTNTKNGSEISASDVADLAKLTRIAISEAEQDVLAKDFVSILDYVSEVSKLTADSDGSDLPRHRNVMRDDESAHESGVHTDKLLKAMADSEDGYMKVKKILS